MKPPIEPTRVYTVEETAELLGFRGSSEKAKTNAVYDIDPAELPRTRTGAGGGRVGFLGLVVIRFLVNRTDEPGVDLEDMVRLSKLGDLEHRPPLIELTCPSCLRTVRVDDEQLATHAEDAPIHCPFCSMEEDGRYGLELVPAEPAGYSSVGGSR